MSKSSLLTTTFRSWNRKEKEWALALKIERITDFRMIHQKTHSRGNSRIALQRITAKANCKMERHIIGTYNYMSPNIRLQS